MGLPLALLPLLCCLAGWGASACTFDHLFNFFNCLACVRAFFRFALVCLIHSVVIVYGAGDIRLLFKLLLKFRNVIKHTERRSSLACNQKIRDDIPKALEVFLCFETKRNDINSPRKYSRNARVISAEELGTMSKNNLGGINVDIGPVLGIHSLTLIISCPWGRKGRSVREIYFSMSLPLRLTSLNFLILFSAEKPQFLVICEKENGKITCQEGKKNQHTRRELWLA